MSFLFNAALCWDLILVLHNPFKSAEARLQKYVIISVSLLVIETIILKPLQAYMKYSEFLKVFDVVTWIPIIAFIVSATISAIYAVFKLSSPGISSEVKFVILRRHIITIVFFFIANLYEMTSIVQFIRFGFENQ